MKQKAYYTEMRQVAEPEAEEYKAEAKKWEEIAESRMKEIRRLRSALGNQERGLTKTTFIKAVGTEQTGGGIMVDFVKLHGRHDVIGISEDMIVLYPDMEHFCGGEEDIKGSITLEEEQAKYAGKEIPKHQQIAYLEEVQRTLTELRNQMHRLNLQWGKDDTMGFDLNDFLAPQYPLGASFDELIVDVDIWYQTSWVALNRKIKVLQGYDPKLVYGEKYNPDTLGEPPAPYYTPQEAQGKWICGFDTMLGGWDCVRYSGGEHNNLPVLYDSEKEVTEDDFFDPNEDFAIPASDFIEGRRAIFTDKGLRFEGTPIVKGCKIVGNIVVKNKE